LNFVGRQADRSAARWARRREQAASVVNASAAAIFALSREVHWIQAAVGASFGGWAGALMLKRVNERLLKLAAVAIGAALTVGLFWKAP
jgi:uncharacterized protein